jgi:hypothetical protein
LIHRFRAFVSGLDDEMQARFALHFGNLALHSRGSRAPRPLPAQQHLRCASRYAGSGIID